MTKWHPDLTDFTNPLYRAIADALGRDIANGTLRPGDRLPTHRDLADRLNVTVGTVTRAYAEAERRGLVGGEVGRGTFVRDQRQATRPDAMATTQPIQEHAKNLPEAAVDLSICLPTMDGVEESLGQITAELHKEGVLSSLLGYGVAAGYPHHREAAAAWLNRQAGLRIDPDRVLLTVGAQNAMIAAMMSLTKSGDVIATEGLAYPGVKTAAAAFGLRLEAISLDRHGLDPDALETACRRLPIKLLYTVPNLQNPTTAIQTLERRQTIIAIAQRHGVTILEDDVFGFLVPDAPPALQTLAPGQTVYISSLSKCVAPGLRIGFLVAPASLVQYLESALRTLQFAPPLLMTEIAHRLMATREADRFAENNRREARARQHMARECLPESLLFGNSVGHHLWLLLPTAWPRDRFVSATMNRGVAVTNADVFAMGEFLVPHAVRLALSTPPLRQAVKSGLQIIADILAQPAPPPNCLAIV